MIRLLRGRVVAVQGNKVTIETSGGVGYLVSTHSHSTLMIGDEAYLHTYLAVRENALDLYGFAAPNDLDCFEILLNVPGVGPKTALQILDQAGRTLIIEAVLKEDPEHLSKRSTVSKKMAEKIIISLKGKLSPNLQENTALATDNSVYQDAFETLITLGYNPQNINSVLQELTEYETVSALVTEALQRLK